MKSLELRCSCTSSFGFAVDPHSKMPTFKDWDSLVGWLSVQYKANGARASAATIPVDFAKFGPWDLYHSGGKWMLRHRFSGTVSVLCVFDDPEGKLELYVDQNFSDVKAAIRSKFDSTILRICFSVVSAAAPCSSGESSAGLGSSKLAQPGSRASVLAIVDGTPPAALKRRRTEKSSPCQSMPKEQDAAEKKRGFEDTETAVAKTAVTETPAQAAAAAAEASFAPPPPAFEEA